VTQSQSLVNTPCANRSRFRVEFVKVRKFTVAFARDDRTAVVHERPSALSLPDGETKNSSTTTDDKAIATPKQKFKSSIQT
jgi:hypothetical protein